MKIRISGVPEHFNLPILLAIEEWNSRSNDFVWQDVASGTGAMVQQLKDKETDCAILLTEGAMVAVENGLEAGIHNVYVSSALNWGIHVSSKSKIDSLQMAKPNFLVSRIGSGSHLMAKVLSEREKWKQKDLSYTIINNLDGARKEMAEGVGGMFLWEKYTTMPFVENGEMKRIGEIPTPWPCFVLVINNSVNAEAVDKIYQLMTLAQEKSKWCKSAESIDLFVSRYKLQREKVMEWQGQTSWFGVEWNDKLSSEIRAKLVHFGLLPSK